MAHAELGIHSLPILRLVNPRLTQGKPPLHRNKVAPEPAPAPPMSPPSPIPKSKKAFLLEPRNLKHLQDATATMKSFDTVYALYALALRTNSAPHRCLTSLKLRDNLDTLTKTQTTPDHNITEQTIEECKKILKDLPYLIAQVKDEQETLRKFISHRVDSNCDILKESPEYLALQTFRTLGFGIAQSAQDAVEKVLNPGDIGHNKRIKEFEETHLLAMTTAVTAKETVDHDIATETKAIQTAAWRTLTATHNRLLWLSPWMRPSLKPKITAFRSALAAITKDIRTQTPENFKIALNRSRALRAAWLLAEPQNTKAIKEATATLKSFDTVYDVSELARHTLRKTPKETLIPHDPATGKPTTATQLRDALATLKKIQTTPAPTAENLVQLRKTLATLSKLRATLKREQKTVLKAALPEIIGRRTQTIRKITTNKDRLPTSALYKTLLSFRALDLRSAKQSAQDCIDQILNPGNIGENTRPEKFNGDHMRAMQSALGAKAAVSGKMRQEIEAIKTSGQRRFTVTDDRLRRLTPEMRTPLNIEIQAFANARNAITEDKKTQTLENFRAALQCGHALDRALMLQEPQNAQLIKKAAATRDRFSLLYKGSSLLPWETVRECVPHAHKGLPLNIQELCKDLDALKKFQRMPTDAITEFSLIQARQTLKTLPERIANLEAANKKMATPVSLEIAYRRNARERLLRSPTYNELLEFRTLIAVKPIAQDSIDQIMNPGDIGKKNRPADFTTQHISAMQSMPSDEEVFSHMNNEIDAIKRAAMEVFYKTQEALSTAMKALRPESASRLTEEMRAFTVAIANIHQNPTPGNYQTALTCSDALNRPNGTVSTMSPEIKATQWRRLTTVHEILRKLPPAVRQTLNPWTHAFVRARNTITADKATQTHENFQAAEAARIALRRNIIGYITKSRMTIAKTIDDTHSAIETFERLGRLAKTTKPIEDRFNAYAADIQNALTVLHSKDLPTQNVTDDTLDSITADQFTALQAAVRITGPFSATLTAGITVIQNCLRSNYDSEISPSRRSQRDPHLRAQAGLLLMELAVQNRGPSPLSPLS